MCDFDADFFFANCASKSLISLCLVIERILSTNKNREYFYAIQKTEIQRIPALPRHTDTFEEIQGCHVEFGSVRSRFAGGV